MILVVRAPFKGQGAIWAQEGTHSSVDTLMNLDLKKNTDVKSVCFFQSFYLSTKYNAC